MGDRNTTVQNLEIEKIDFDENVLLVKGAVPGSIGSFVKVTPSINDGAKLSLEQIVEEAVDETKTEEVVENIAEVATPEAPKEETQNTEAKETIDVDTGTEDIKEETKEAEAADETPKEETDVAEEQNKAKKEDEKE